MAVIGDTVVTMAKLGPKVKFLVDEDLCRRGVETAINNVRWVLAILSDVERADFVEAATGARCLPLTTDQHSMIQVSSTGMRTDSVDCALNVICRLSCIRTIT